MSCCCVRYHMDGFCDLMRFSTLNEYLFRFQCNWTLIYRSYGAGWTNSFRIKRIFSTNFVNKSKTRFDVMKIARFFFAIRYIHAKVHAHMYIGWAVAKYIRNCNREIIARKNKSVAEWIRIASKSFKLNILWSMHRCNNEYLNIWNCSRNAHAIARSSFSFKHLETGYDSNWE